MLGFAGFGAGLAQAYGQVLRSTSALLTTALTEETKLHIDVNEVKKILTLDGVTLIYTYTLPGFIITESYLMGSAGPKYSFTSGETTIATDGQLAKYAQDKINKPLTPQDLTKWGIV